MVAAGILASRILGLVRNRVFAHFFGTSDAADTPFAGNAWAIASRVEVRLAAAAA